MESSASINPQGSDTASVILAKARKYLPEHRRKQRCVQPPFRWRCGSDSGGREACEIQAVGRVFEFSRFVARIEEAIVGIRGRALFRDEQVQSCRAGR